MNRKTQLEKFNAKQAKIYKDTEVIQEAKIKNNKQEAKSKKIMEAHGKTTEDIFAIITRDSIGSFVKLWNNSMESTMKETLQNEIRLLVREVIQEEMLSAYKGILKGLIGEELKNTVANEMKGEFQNEDVANQDKQSDVEEFEKEKKSKNEKNEKQQTLRTSAKSKQLYEKAEQLIIESHYMNQDPQIGIKFKKLSSHHNNIYQKFMILNKGIRGAWRDYVVEIIEKTENSDK